MRNIDQTYLEKNLLLLDLSLVRLLRRKSAGTQPVRLNSALPATEEALRLVLQPPYSTFGYGTETETDLETYLQIEAKIYQEIAALLETCTETPRLVRLQHDFSLSDFEVYLLIVCIAPFLDMRYLSIYAALQDDTAGQFASGELLTAITGDGYGNMLAVRQALADGGTLQKHGLLRRSAGENWLMCCYSVPESVVQWLLSLPMNTAGECKLILPSITDTQADCAFHEKLKYLMNGNALVSLVSSDFTNAQRAVQACASALNMNLLQVCLPKQGNIKDDRNFLIGILRDARLCHACILISHAERWADNESRLSTDVFSKVWDLPLPIIFLSVKPILLERGESSAGRLFVRIMLHGKNALERLTLWKSAIDACNGLAQSAVSDEALRYLAGQFVLITEQIESAVAFAAGVAASDNRLIQLDDLLDAARTYSFHHLGTLATKMTPRYDWGDLILPDLPRTMLQEMTAMARNRAMVLEEWGLGKKLTSSAGISALFTGPPGTGKTLSAQVIANALGMELYRIDLSTVISKYIGETEKNLERIFSEAQNSNAILFFDEADSIFGKRSEVKDSNDRYANIEVGYLLQRIETYDGIAILSTNLGANLDEAFTRRIHFIIDFPFPDEQYREKLWQVLMPENVPQDVMDFHWLAEQYRIAGGNIRNAIVAAVFIAAERHETLNMKHIQHGVMREFQKMGRVFREENFNEIG